MNKDVIFLEDRDRERFLRALVRTRELSGCTVLAYCLMDNHVHLVLRTSVEPIGLVATRLAIRYAAWFNRTYGRVGHLFQDRFLSVPVETDDQLTVLLRYVWQNPVEAGLVERAEDYPWCSRRYLDGGSALLEAGDLAKLLPPGTLDQLAAATPAAPTGDTSLGPTWTTRRTADDARRVLRRVAGICCPDEFAALDLTMRRRLIRELRIRSVSYARIGEVTGLSASAVRRLHVAGAGA